MEAERYKIFPPRWRNLRLPTSSKGAAASTLAMWSPCRRSGQLLQRLGWVTLNVLGVRFLPGTSAPWEPPWDGVTGERLSSEWRAVVGDFDTMGIYLQPQKARHGLVALLLKSGRPVAFVKLRTGEASVVHPALAHEHQVLQLMDTTPVTAFVYPRPIALGGVEGWSYCITSAIEGGLDRPAVTDHVGAVLADIRTGLAGLPRGEEVPEDWEPMHGDLTPWNLRVSGNGLLKLVDWEGAGWAPSGADAVLLHASRCALFGTIPPRLPREAADYWLQRITDQRTDSLDARLRRDLTSALHDIAARPTRSSGPAATQEYPRSDASRPD